MTSRVGLINVSMARRKQSRCSSDSCDSEKRFIQAEEPYAFAAISLITVLFIWRQTVKTNVHILVKVISSLPWSNALNTRNIFLPSTEVLLAILHVISPTRDIVRQLEVNKLTTDDFSKLHFTLIMHKPSTKCQMYIRALYVQIKTPCKKNVSFPFNSKHVGYVMYGCIINVGL